MIASWEIFNKEKHTIQSCVIITQLCFCSLLG